MAAAKKAAAPKKVVAPASTGLIGGKLETFKSGDAKSATKFKKALNSGNVGSMGHAGGQWENLT